MTGTEAPFDPNSNSRNKRSPSTSRSSGTGKSSWKSSSDSPIQAAYYDAGFDIARHKLRSVLTHPLGLPLLFAFHNKETENMKYLSQTRTQFNQEQIEALDGLFQKAVEGTENKQDENEVKEKPITGLLTKLIEEQCQTLSYRALSEVSITDDKNQKTGVMDIILTHDENKDQAFETPPLAVLEFGLNAGDWWSKLHQGTLYLEMMRNLALQNLAFDQPILLMIVTIYNNRNTNIVSESNFRMGVFMCVPNGANSSKGDRYCISLLWHSQTNSLFNASIYFGKLLRVTADFASWRHDHRSPTGYEYFSSNCCKVATHDSNGKETEMLQALHEAGFVHGDIRAYNIVFKDRKKGWLIDFDFGGKSDVQTYPKGYRQSLNDGIRIGEDGKAITKYHDWYALGTLMFTIHSIPEDAQSSENLLMILQRWTLLEADKCTDNNIEALKDFLEQFIGKTITMKLRPPFEAAVKENTTEAQITKKGATGSPLQ
ncbi:RIO1 family protein [Nitzschia inconspicua]|uniref:RIO1 family protein n=1 Tax=Nitzschia inconspicua TaxID=303405 RepID=A0A9K3PSK0_9STRA|nr:RIO1 family protein [Nitzschia inconspicua]